MTLRSYVKGQGQKTWFNASFDRLTGNIEGQDHMGQGQIDKCHEGQGQRSRGSRSF